MKDWIKRVLGIRGFLWIKRIYLRLLALPFGYNLNMLARIYGSDKWGQHFYTSHYRTHFRKYKFKRIKLLEIGIGGYHYPDRGGNSLRMWKRYFPFGKIYGLDIYDKSFVEESRIKTFQGSQTDPQALAKLLDHMGAPDIIIDDGSHLNEHVIETFHLLFPKLKDGGVYVIEDTQTSYWPDYGGDSENLSNPRTTINFVKRLTDCINHKEFLKSHYTPSYFDEHIVSIHFYHNLLFIFKDLNNELSSIDAEDPESTLVDKLYL